MLLFGKPHSNGMYYKFLLLIGFVSIQYTVYLLSFNAGNAPEPRLLINDVQPRKVEIKMIQGSPRETRETEGENHCGDISCDDFVQCLLEKVDKNKSMRALDIWKRFKNDSCNTKEAKSMSVTGFCKFLLETAEVQLGFLIVGVLPFPKVGFVLSKNITNITYVDQEACAPSSQEESFTTPTTENDNKLITCMGAAAGVDYVVIDVRSFNESYPEHKEAYRKGDNTSLTYDKWIEPLNNETAFVCGAIDVKVNMTYWINVDCGKPIDVACVYEIKESEIVEHMQTIEREPTDASSAGLQAIEDGTEQASRHPILAGNEILNLTYVQMSVRIEDKLPPSSIFHPPDLDLDVTQTSVDFNTTGAREIVATVVGFTRLTNDTLQNDTVADSSSLDVRTLEAPDEVPFVTVSAWNAEGFLLDDGVGSRKKRNDDNIQTVQGNVTLLFKKVSAQNLCESITLELLNSTTTKVTELANKCVFLDETELYLTRGCTTRPGENDDTTICTCNHTTLFSVLLAVTKVTIPPGVKTLTFVTESLSVAFLIATIVIVYRYKNFIKGDGVPIQINLAVVLLFVHALNLLHDSVVAEDNMCFALAISIHYFFLAAGTWMFVEGIRIFMVTLNPIRYNSQSPRKRFKIFMTIGWISPAIIVVVGISLGITQGEYIKPQPFYTRCNKYREANNQINKYNRCWMEPGTWVFYGTLLGPLAVMLILNFVVAIQTSLVMLKSKRQAKRNRGHSYQDLTRATKSFFFLFLMLGGTWILAFFTGVGNTTSQILFMYLNSLINGSQGIIVFVLFCILNDAIRDKLFPFMKPPGQKRLSQRKVQKSDTVSKGVDSLRATSLIATYSTNVFK